MSCLHPVSVASLLWWPLCSVEIFLRLTWLWCTERRPAETEMRTFYHISVVPCLQYWREQLNNINTSGKVKRSQVSRWNSGSWVWCRWGKSKLGMFRRVRDGGECNFPINCFDRTNKLQSGSFVLAAPLPPLSHTSCDSPKHSPGAIREVPVHVSPGAGPLSQGNRCSQRNDQTSSELTRTWLLASTISLSFCLHHPVWGQFLSGS